VELEEVNFFSFNVGSQGLYLDIMAFIYANESGEHDDSCFLSFMIGWGDVWGLRLHILGYDLIDLFL